ncbi:hypothetical protein C482_07501 [Natrialba chahannaoensis JCM 10990]|uniref:Uncharacterized protein n=1 Tax=Natrialba chahannaoensis JCM 10990 TaxID=1227492 RepID=M0ARH1_9EURY|nr:hypothetical protein [Natrialba chahannaoensis]ELZ01321.1 hypothetical protein C482_07501 [Natrialba chahannaoensis JCM 10990]
MTGVTGGIVSHLGHGHGFRPELELGFGFGSEFTAQWQYQWQGISSPPGDLLASGVIPSNTLTLELETVGIATVAVAVISIAVVAIVSGITRWLWQRYHQRRESPPLSSLAADLDDHLAAALGPGTGSHLETPPTVRRLERVDDDPAAPVAGTPTPIIPVIRIDLGTADTPGLGLVLEYVAAALETVHPVLEGDECAFDEGERDVRVRYYEFEVTFGPSGLLVSGECRRIVVPVTCAEQLCSESRYGVHELQRELESDAGGGGVPSVLWEPC